MNVDSYIDTIARALAARDGRGGGRATAMIGAGFSLNADPQSNNAQSFPLWRDIVRPLIDEMLPPCAECPRRGACPGIAPRGCKIWDRRVNLFSDSSGASGMMALGDKFEAQKGAARLRAALERSVPDEDYGPGRAHQLLVRLPWADILTTNWDSLLERAVDTFDRSYDTVVTVEQIASTAAPRIVKLHGCSRSGTRLIFTEEDFRTYPRRNAPFVSMVQQSMMENVMVLIGFSGADPNFRAWHGWVRDQLGTNIQPLYVVSLRQTDPIDVNLMAGRLINHINLSERWPNASSQEMVELFLSEIQSRLRRLRLNLDWPLVRTTVLEGASRARLESGYPDWSERLKDYPAWIIAPARNREDLIANLDEHLGLALDPDTQSNDAKFGMLQSGDDSDGRLRARAALAIDICKALAIAFARPTELLLGILSDILLGAILRSMPDATAHAEDRPGLGDVGRRLDAMARFPEGISGEASQAPFWRAIGMRLRSETEDLRTVVTQYLPIIEVVERESRLAGNLTAAQACRALLWTAGDESVARELAVRGAVSIALTRFDLAEVRALLELWPSRSHDAAANLRRAAVWREIGSVSASYEEIDGIVTRLRTLGSARHRGVAEISREAWAFYLFHDLIEANAELLQSHIYRHQKDISVPELLVELQERLDELSKERCDPRPEMHRLYVDLLMAAEREFLYDNMQVEAVRRIRKQNSRYILSGPEHTFLLFSETVGLPIHQTYRNERLALVAARLLARTQRDVAVQLLLRAGNPEDLSFEEPARDGEMEPDDPDEARPNWRESIAGIVLPRGAVLGDFEKFAELLSDLVAARSSSRHQMIDPGYLDRKARLLQHLITGLVTRADSASIAQIAQRGFTLALAMSHSSIVAATQAGWSNLLALYAALLSDRMRGHLDPCAVLLELLEVPMPAKTGGDVLRAWPDPFRLLVSCWRTTGPDADGRIEAEVRPIGSRLIAGVRDRIQTDRTLSAGLADWSGRLRSDVTTDTGELALIKFRRRVVVSRALGDPPT